MNPDDFEKQLRRLPVRPIPAGWRAQILGAANVAPVTPRAACPTPSFLSTLNSRLSTIFWPNPAAWAGLAAVWLVIFTVNHAATDPSGLMAKKSSVSSADIFMAMQQQQRELARLIEPAETTPAEPPKSAAPRPRGELKTRITLV
jgi:hypothetical protein